MDQITTIILSKEFLGVALVVGAIMYFFNSRLGPSLWRIKPLRKFLKIMEGTKLIWPPLIGLGIGFIPKLPRPEAMSESPAYQIAVLYFIAGMCSTWAVKMAKKALEARGIDIDLDLTPKQQKKQLPANGSKE